MPAIIHRIISLAEAGLSQWEETPTTEPATRASRPMSFSDLQQSLHDYSTGQTNDNTFRNGILVVMAFIAVIALSLHLYQRHKTAAPSDSIGYLGWELGRKVRFPFGARLLLWWVARSNKVPFASLLLSSAHFDKCVTTWATQSTFGIARQWGRSRLEMLRPVLFT